MQVHLGAAAVFLLVVFLIMPAGYLGPLSARVRGLFVQHTRTGNPLVDSVAEHQEDKARIKSKIVAKMLKGTLSAAFATWAQHTVEQNEGVRQKLTVDEALAEKDRMLDEFRELVAEMCAKEGEWFNDDNHYKDAMTWSLDTKRGIIRKYQELRGERFKRYDRDVKMRILQSRCIQWAREGTVYRIISNTRHFPWHAVAEGKAPEVMLRPDLSIYIDR